jgi:hypothetical protein
MKRSVLYGKDEIEREMIVDYLSERIEIAKKENDDFVSHLYPVSTSYVSKDDYEISDRIVNDIKDYENNVPGFLNGNISTILINGTLAERIFKVYEREGKVNGYDKDLIDLIYDQVYILDEELMSKLDEVPVLSWYKNNGAVFTPVVGVGLDEKAEFIYFDSLESKDILNPNWILKEDFKDISDKISYKGMGYY